MAVDLVVNDWISAAAYYRLLLGDALPEYSSCLYLDCDILVRGSITDLLERQLTQPIAAVRDPQNPRLAGGEALPGWEQLGLLGNREYFNSGVMLFDLDACRSSGLFERAWWFLDRFPGHVRYWDQDALNWAAEDHWQRLDRTWNTFPMSAIMQTPGPHSLFEDIMPLATLLADEAAARILHYTGPVKPWHPTFPVGRARSEYHAAMLNTIGHVVIEGSGR
jgi:UDP-D-galactose:(glucosyl)LPS alpha-1,3-D-galactosyltransferase